jgi:hypothetical protein
MKAAFSFVLAALLAAGAATVFADLYRWVDQNGNVQYSDKPPPAGARIQKPQQIKKKSEKKNSAAAPAAADKPAPDTAPATGPKTPAEQEADFRKRQVEKSEKEAAEQKGREEAAAKERNCAQARAQVVTLKTGRVTRPNARGEQEYLNDQQIAAETKAAEKAVSDWCK